MLLRSALTTAIALSLSASAAAAQATFTPSYNAPYRSFEAREFGGTFSFPHKSRDYALEGQFRFGHGKFDIGFRGGVFRTEVGGSGSTDVIVGVEGRSRLFDHTEGQIPLDAAVVVGVGTFKFDAWTLPSAGISLGRRVNIGSFSFVAYGQPTFFLLVGSGDTDAQFGLGLGADFRVGRALDLRASAGLFDGPEGIAVSLVWVR
jgi:hypothetical protein